jgi:hypothetical protein
MARYPKRNKVRTLRFVHLFDQVLKPCYRWCHGVSLIFCPQLNALLVLLIRLIFLYPNFLPVLNPVLNPDQKPGFDDQIFLLWKKYCTGHQKKKRLFWLACLDPNPRTPLYSDPLSNLNLDLCSLTGESECSPDLGYETSAVIFSSILLCDIVTSCRWHFFNPFLVVG